MKYFSISYRLSLFLAFALVMGSLGIVSPIHAQETTPEVPLTSPPRPAGLPTAIPAERPAPVASLTDGPFTLEIFFSQLPQGEVGLVRVFGESLTGARGRFLEQNIEFFPAADGYYALLAVNMEQATGTADLLVVALGDADTRVTFTTQVEIIIGGFITQDFTIGADRAYLLDTEIERSEFARLDLVFAPVTTEVMWTEGGFRLPINAELTSPFGAFRNLNQSFLTRHTGWDLRAATGTPIAASAGGRVAFAGLLDVRGNYVVIDHGYGVYTGYAHLSQIHVTRGQRVSAAQIIGVSGTTGRSNGPHLHWEMVVNGQWVNSWDFVQMWLP